jgi:hypothetical protein
MTPDADERAKGVDLPSWWLEKVRAMVDERKEQFDESLVQLGAALADAVGREEAWDHSTVSRFLRNKNTTIPMAEAFSSLLGLPKPFFVPQSLDEALALQQVVNRHRKRLTEVQERRLAFMDEAADTALLEGQTTPLKSGHEGTDRSRRPGRTSRSR